MDKERRLPKWLKMQRASGEKYSNVKKLIASNRLNTICTSGNCPNIGECWNAGTATFMILGDICTRACRFCATKCGKPLPPDPDEPLRIAESVKMMGLSHCVITSVDRDDLPDKGSSFWARTIRTVREVNPSATIETLIPDFDGDEVLLGSIIAAAPDVISHNVETVRRLTPLIRTRARYDRSLSVLRFLSSGGIRTKSGLMVGLGETKEEVLETIGDIHEAGCDVITIGQYLQPTFAHMEAVEYVRPEIFTEYRNFAIAKGFIHVESSPLVRSSFHAENHVRPRLI